MAVATEVNFNALAPAAVIAREEYADSSNTSGIDMQALAQLLGQAKVSGAVASKRGGIKLSDISGAKASAKASNGNTIMSNIDNFGNLSEFSILMKDSGAAGKLEEAASNGTKVTVFAPTNDALAAMPDMGFVLMKRSAKHADMRDAFVAQHAVMDMDEQFASAQYSLDGMGAAIETLQEGAHISIQGDLESPMAAAQLAVQHDDDGAITSAARIQGSYLTPEGHTVHFLNAPLA